MTKSNLVTFTEETFNGKLHFLFSIFPTRNNHYSLRATDRFVQPIFLRIFRCIGAIVRGNGCDICWSAVICMGDSWPRAQSISPNLTIFTRFLIWPNFVQRNVLNKGLFYTKKTLTKLTAYLPHKIYGQFLVW